MISISKLGGSGQAASYYDKADYYTKGEDGVDISSSFQGELAKDFGLEGAVSKEKLVSLLDGKTPDGKMLGRVVDGKIQHTPGWDLTFSAPKSVSILALIGNDKSVIKAHHEAVQRTLNYVERDILKSRVNKANQKGEVNIEKALFAKFTHSTSRKLDPQLHTHSVLVNMGKDEEGNLRSLDSRVVYENKMLLGQIYRNELAVELKKQGYALEWDSNKGLFEVAGVSKELIENFSKRREDIEKKSAELGISDAKGLEKVTVGTRDKKQNIPSKLVLDSWDEQAKDMGYNPNELEGIAKKEAKKIENQKPRGMMGNIFKAYKEKDFNPVEKAVEQLSYYEAAFKESEVLKESLKFARGDITYNEVKDKLEELKEKGEVITSKFSKGFLTTKEAVRQENYILKVEVDNRNSVKAIAEMPEIEAKMKEYQFSGGQKEGFVHLLRNEDRFSAIQGHAGVGKTYMMRPFVQIAKDKGYEVISVAPMGKAADELGKSIGVETNTLASLLHDLEKKEGKESSKANNSKVNDNKIYIVDEGSTINSRDMADLVTQVSRNGGRVIFAGDRAQLGGVERGKTFAQLQDNGMSTSVNKDILRQRNSPELLKSIENYYDGEIDKAFEILSNDIIENKDENKRLNSFVEEYLKKSQSEKKHIAVIMDNKTRDKGTDLIRGGLKEQGVIGKEDLVVKNLVNAKVDGAKKSMAEYYEKGMKVRFLQPYKRLGVEKNEYYKVIKSNTREVVLSDGKKTVKWQPDKVAGNKEKGGVVAYNEVERKYSIGDLIRFKDRNNEDGYKNGTMGKVVDIDITSGKLVVELSDTGKRVSIDSTKERQSHFEHGYIDTAFVSQGATAVSAQVMAESYRKNLLNDSSMLVGITRPEIDVKIYVDDKNKVIQAVKERSGMKQGALDHTYNRPETYKPVIGNKETNQKEINKQLDTFVSKPPIENKQFEKQVDREKTFLP